MHAQISTLPQGEGCLLYHGGGFVSRYGIPSLSCCNVDEYEALPECRFGEALVKCNKLQIGRPPVGADEGGGKLQCLGRTKGMHAKESPGRLADDFAGFYLQPAIRKIAKPFESQSRRIRIKPAAAFPPRHGGDAFHLGPLPREHFGIAIRERQFAALMVSATINGTISEASQNFIGLPGVPRGELQAPKRRRGIGAAPF
jgi:hypothetical protein